MRVLKWLLQCCGILTRYWHRELTHTVASSARLTAVPGWRGTAAASPADAGSAAAAAFPAASARDASSRSIWWCTICLCSACQEIKLSMQRIHQSNERSIVIIDVLHFGCLRHQTAHAYTKTHKSPLLCNLHHRSKLAASDANKRPTNSQVALVCLPLLEALCNRQWLDQQIRIQPKPLLFRCLFRHSHLLCHQRLYWQKHTIGIEASGASSCMRHYTWHYNIACVCSEWLNWWNWMKNQGWNRKDTHGSRHPEQLANFGLSLGATF